jgi:hypothetical protein
MKNQTLTPQSLLSLIINKAQKDSNTVQKTAKTR